MNHNVAIQYDETAKAPHFNYVDAEGKQHVVWFEDARSMRARFNLVKKYGLRGVNNLRVLGSHFPQNWLLIEDLFHVNKIV